MCFAQPIRPACDSHAPITSQDGVPLDRDTNDRARHRGNSQNVQELRSPKRDVFQAPFNASSYWDLERGSIS